MPGGFLPYNESESFTEEADEQQPKYSHIIQDDFQQSRGQGKGLEFRNPRFSRSIFSIHKLV